MHGGSWDWVCDVSGMPLGLFDGLFDGLPYGEHVRALKEGDMSYLHIDGVTESMNVGGELFGEEKLEKVLDRRSAMNARLLRVGVGVGQVLADFTLDVEQSDDMTMLCL